MPIFKSLISLFILSTTLQSADIKSFDAVNEVVLLKTPAKDDQQGWQKTVFDGIERALQEEGTSVVRAKSCYFVRDAKVATAKNGILRTTDKVTEENATIISQRIVDRERFLKNNHASCATDHDAFMGKGLGSGIKGQYYKRVADGFSPQSYNSFYDDQVKAQLAQSPVQVVIKPSRSVLEGGNVIWAINQAGVQKVLIGEETLLWTHMHLRLSGFFKAPGSGTDHDIEEGDPIVGEFFKLNDEINRQWRGHEIPGLVKTLGKSLTLSDGQYLALGQEMAAMGLLKGNIDKATLALKGHVEEYVGQREYITQVLWPEEFDIAKENIIVMPQAAYHLDVFMNPAPQGGMLVQSFAKSALFLSDLLIDNMRNLSDKDKKLLNGYIDNALKLNRDLAPIYDKVYQLLKQAGFNVIKTPGAFYGMSGSQSVNINFINGLSGWSAKNSHNYYLCLGAQVRRKNRLGQLLMDKFSAFLQQEITQVKVHFIGSNGHDFFAAMHFNNMPLAMAGVHCMTYELKKSKR